MKAESTLQQVHSTRFLHRVLELGIFLKGFDAFLEMIGGGFFLFASNLTLDKLVIALTQHELLEDPQDKIALFLRQSVFQLSPGTHLFGGLYLMIHGFTKLWLVTNLLRRRLWAYPATLCFLSLFIAYQLYHLSFNYSMGLALLTVFDGIFASLIWREYKLTKKLMI